MKFSIHRNVLSLIFVVIYFWESDYIFLFVLFFASFFAFLSVDLLNFLLAVWLVWVTNQTCCSQEMSRSSSFGFENVFLRIFTSVFIFVLFLEMGVPSTNRAVCFGLVSAVQAGSFGFHELFHGPFLNNTLFVYLGCFTHNYKLLYKN